MSAIHFSLETERIASRHGSLFVSALKMRNTKTFSLILYPHSLFGYRSRRHKTEYSACTLSIYSHGPLVCAKCGFVLSFWKMYDVPGKICHLKAACVTFKCQCSFLCCCWNHRSVKDLFEGHWYIPLPSQSLSFGLHADNRLNDPFLLSDGPTEMKRGEV